jgi:DHA1 family bicyclomycin/chloramphenicol resistance-like MFS transporter
MSLLILVFSVSPILAPLTGSFLVEWQGWRAVFWFVFAASMLSLVLLWTRLKETRPHHARAESTVRASLRAYRSLLGDWHFLGLTFTGAFGMSSFFSYLSNSSFLVMEHYHHSARAFGVIFGVNAFAFIAASQGAGVLIARFGMARVVRISVWGYCLSMLALFAVFAAGVDRLDVLVAFLFVGFGFLGLVIPTSSVMALEEHGPIAGTASALLGTLQFATGALVMTLTAPFGNATAMPMVTSIAVVAVISLVLAMLSVRELPVTADSASELEPSSVTGIR